MGTTETEPGPLGGMMEALAIVGGLYMLLIRSVAAWIFQWSDNEN